MEIEPGAPCAAVTAKGAPCPIPGQYPYGRVLVCHLHNPAGFYASQHPNFRRKLERMLAQYLEADAR